MESNEQTRKGRKKEKRKKKKKRKKKGYSVDKMGNEEMAVA